MPPPSAAGGRSAVHDFGTMLDIKKVRMLPDGRSMVETKGTYRFRIMERGSMDGYMVSRIERCVQRPVTLVALSINPYNFFCLYRAESSTVHPCTATFRTSLMTRLRSRPQFTHQLTSKLTGRQC